ncbi:MULTISPECIES: bacteriocin immunity protein [unclassified Pseudomonas]|jgi:hypothetical protein|uniref:bacteriocin immunity protein n=1 Tax=unclassified Pseudomonas TaxID=196821 RepID=UPI000B3FF0D1|nr:MULTISPECIES: bacteriocin immunity protein [unclassified Pseudomonas]NWB38973.1 bacteriocin immunity protein [Pseudomonas sp. E6002]NWD00688.1 bacteriocin immunity protein [Pseudomonas sp. P7779]NWD62253.1 bacteriocin immunity protein [Pseudomonas sp. IPO3774]
MANITDYTEEEFVSLINQILIANKGGTDAELGGLIEQFRQISGHPDGSDLIFYPAPSNDSSAEGVALTVKAWRAAHGLPGFKDA